MAKLTVVSGGLSGKPAFSMNAHGVAKYMIASAYAQRKVVEDYAFPKEDKTKQIIPSEAKLLIQRYFKSGKDVAVLADAIRQHSIAPDSEKPSQKGHRKSALAAAHALQHMGDKLKFDEIHRKFCDITIERLPVRSSIDFFCKTKTGKVIAVIFNVSAQLSDDKQKLSHYAAIESEIAWQATRLQMPSVEEIWHVDLLSDGKARKQKTSNKAAWRNIQTTADNILITYGIVLARRARERKTGS